MDLLSLRSAGFTVSADAGHLLVSPGATLTPDQRDEIRANRDALLAALRVEAETMMEHSARAEMALARIWRARDADAMRRAMEAMLAISPEPTP